MDAQGVSGEILMSYIERLERLEEEKVAVTDSIRDVFQEAKGNGFDVPAMRELLKLRKLDREEADERDVILDIYKKAIGME
ncbi:MAG: DUF2312 domain-containing protein [Magnetococcales bacterium]|nr:DUF2312 domain-containing protein [Magnetococcales bacterium]